MHITMEYLAGILHEFAGDAVWKAILAAGGVFLGLSGYGGAANQALLMLMCIDFILGFYRAWMDAAVSPARLKRGLLKFGFYLVAIIAAYHVDQALNAMTEPVVHVGFTAFLTVYLVLCEALSVFRHLYCLGVPIPKRLIRRLETMRDCQLSGDARTK